MRYLLILEKVGGSRVFVASDSTQSIEELSSLLLPFNVTIVYLPFDRDELDAEFSDWGLIEVISVSIHERKVSFFGLIWCRSG